MNDLFYVYVHRKQSDNNIFYVGKGKDYRAFSKKSRNKHWHNIVNKHGLKVEVVLNNLTENQALNLEIELIKFYGLDNLCNMTNGGDGVSGLKHSDKTKNKLRELSIKQFSNPDFLNQHKIREKNKWSNIEMRMKMAEIIKKVSNTKEIKEKISIGVKKAWEKEGFREKMSLIRKTHYSTPEMKKKISEGQKKRFNNEIYLKEHRERQKKLSKPLLCVTNGKTYLSQNEAAKDLNISQGGISQVVNGTCKSYKGYVFRKLDNES